MLVDLLTPSCLQRGTGRDRHPRSRVKEGGKEGGGGVRPGGRGDGGGPKPNSTALPQ